MSDNRPTDTDPMLQFLLDRLEAFDAETAERRGRRLELLDLIEVARDGRSRVNRQRRQRATGGNSSKPADTQPGGYDDGVSIDNARGILRPDADAAAEQESVG
jgi:hypothetical protein